MTEMIETDNITITDEVTMLRSENADLRARLESARARIRYLAGEIDGKQQLVDMMTDASTRAKRKLQEQAVRHKRDLERLESDAHSSTVITGIACGTLGFMVAGILVVVYYLIMGY